MVKGDATLASRCSQQARWCARLHLVPRETRLQSASGRSRRGHRRRRQCPQCEPTVWRRSCAPQRVQLAAHLDTKVPRRAIPSRSAVEESGYVSASPRRIEEGGVQHEERKRETGSTQIRRWRALGFRCATVQYFQHSWPCPLHRSIPSLQDALHCPTKCRWLSSQSPRRFVLHARDQLALWGRERGFAARIRSAMRRTADTNPPS